MAPPVTREWAIFYGNTTGGAIGSTTGGTTPIEIGGTSEKFLLINKFGHMRGYRQARVRFSVLVLGTTNSAFVANCQELEDAFRSPRQRLRVVHDGVDFRDYDPATNSGFDQLPEIDKTGSSADTGRSRIYECRVVVRLPSDGTDGEGNDLDGRDLDARINLTYEDNRRRTITVSGTWTALGTNSATDQYEQEIEDYMTDVQNEVDSTATWQLIGTEDNNRNDTNKEMTFTRRVKEITLEQGAGQTNLDPVIKQEISVSRVESGSSDTFINGQLTRPYSRYSIDYNATIDINEISANGLPAYWEGTLRTHAINQALLQLGSLPSGGAIMGETFRSDPENNMIFANFDYKTLNGSLVIQSTLSKTCRDMTGVVLTPVTTGNDFEYDVDEGPPRRELRVEVDETTAGDRFYEYTPPKNFFLLERSETPTETTEGTPEGSITTKKKRTNYTYQFGKKYKPGQSGGGGGGGNRAVARRAGGGGGNIVKDGAGRAIEICKVKNLTGDGI